jgi:hypothetical protein
MATYATAQIKAVVSLAFSQTGSMSNFDVYQCPANRFAVIHLNQIKIFGVNPGNHRLVVAGAEFDGAIDWHIGKDNQSMKEMVINAGEKITSIMVGGGNSSRLIYGTITEYQKPA